MLQVRVGPLMQRFMNIKRKNRLQWLSTLSAHNTGSIEYEDGKSISQFSIEPDKDSAISDKGWNIKPFWFMDSNKRDFNHKDASLYDKHVRVAFLRNE